MTTDMEQTPTTEPMRARLVHFPDEQRDQIEAYRIRWGLRSWAEALRRLVDSGLKAEADA